MIQKNYLTLDNEFIKYCELNSIENPEQYAEEVFKRGFNIVKYGNTPFGFDTSEKIVEKEVIKEIIKEIPVEKIIEKPIEVIKEVIKEITVEVVKEVPIEVKGDTQIVIQEVIKEIPVEKIIEVKNDIELNALRDENERLKSELNKGTIVSISIPKVFIKSTVHLEAIYS